MTTRLLASLQFSDFDFTDLPACVVYASATGCPSKRADEVRRYLSWPQWMHEFVLDIPIVKVVVYDGLILSRPPPDWRI
jgi:hypothetical protein